MNINHILIRTENLKTMTLFLTSIIGLKKGFRPPFPFPGTWLYSSEKPLIHLVNNDPHDPAMTDYLGAHDHRLGGSIDHIAFDAHDYESLIFRLKKYCISYQERTVPLLNQHQVFIKGPEGLKVEMLFASKSDSFEKTD